MFEKFSGGESKDFYNLVTVDGIYIYHHDLETKQRSRDRSVGRKMIAKKAYITTISFYLIG